MNHQDKDKQKSQILSKQILTWENHDAISTATELDWPETSPQTKSVKRKINTTEQNTEPKVNTITTEQEPNLKHKELDLQTPSLAPNDSKASMLEMSPEEVTSPQSINSATDTSLSNNLTDFNKSKVVTAEQFRSFETNSLLTKNSKKDQREGIVKKHEEDLVLPTTPLNLDNVASTKKTNEVDLPWNFITIKEKDFNGEKTLNSETVSVNSLEGTLSTVPQETTIENIMENLKDDAKDNAPSGDTSSKSSANKNTETTFQEQVFSTISNSTPEEIISLNEATSPNLNRDNLENPSLTPEEQILPGKDISTTSSVIEKETLLEDTQQQNQSIPPLEDNKENTSEETLDLPWSFATSDNNLMDKLPANWHELADGTEIIIKDKQTKTELSPTIENANKSSNLALQNTLETKNNPLSNSSTTQDTKFLGSQQQRKKQRKVIRRKPNYLRISALLGIIFLILFYFLFSYFQQTQKFGPVAHSNAINILVLGVDKRAHDGGRSDTMFLLTLDKDTNQASLLSLPRDTRVEISPGKYEKLNHAYAYGGTKLSQKVVENLLNVPIEYYIEIDLQAFETFIDDIGGIDINIPKRMYYEDPYDDNGGLVIDFYPGLQHLDGVRAMEYVRYRDETGDIGRIQRQQDFIHAVLTKVSQGDNLVRLPAIAKHLTEKIQTNLSTGEILKLIPELPNIKEQGLHSYTLPGTPAYIDGVSYWMPNVVEDRQLAAKAMGVTYDFHQDTKTLDFIKHYEEALPKTKHSTPDGTVIYTTTENKNN